MMLMMMTVKAMVSRVKTQQTSDGDNDKDEEATMRLASASNDAVSEGTNTTRLQHTIAHSISLSRT